MPRTRPGRDAEAPFAVADRGRGAYRRSWICGVESAADLRVRQSVGAGGKLSLPMLLLGRAARLPAQLRAFFGTVLSIAPVDGSTTSRCRVLPSGVR